MSGFILFHLVLLTALWDRKYYLHFTDEKHQCGFTDSKCKRFEKKRIQSHVVSGIMKYLNMFTGSMGTLLFCGAS